LGKTLRQNDDTLLPITLTSSGTPVTGLIETDVDVTILKPNDNTFAVKATFGSSDFVEISDGVYHVNLIGAEDLNVLGVNLFKFSKNIGGPGGSFDDLVEEISIIPKTQDSLAAPESCKFFGSLLGLNLQIPTNQVPINVRIAEQPHLTGDFVVVGDRVQTITDGSGDFEMFLPRLAVVVLDIDRAGIRKQFTVPDQESISLIDVLSI